MNTNTPPVGQSATAWARENGEHFTYRAALDNYEPARSSAYGALHFYELRTGDGQRGIILEDASQFRDGRKSMFLIDDGRTVMPHYVAGWNDTTNDDHLVLHPFPTNYDTDGNRRTRPDGRPVDMDLWQLGPKRCYHLKVAPRPTDPLYELLDN